MDIFDAFCTTKKNNNDANHPATKRPAPEKTFGDESKMKILKSGSLVTKKIENIDYSPSPRINNQLGFNFSDCPTPVIRPGVMLSKTMDMPIVAVPQTPVHLSNYGFNSPTPAYNRSNTFVSNESNRVIVEQLPESPRNPPPPKIEPVFTINSSNLKPGPNNLPTIKVTGSSNIKIIPVAQHKPTRPLQINAKEIPKIIVKTISPQQPKKEETFTPIRIESKPKLDIFQELFTYQSPVLHKEYEHDVSEFVEFSNNDAYSNYEAAKFKRGKPHIYAVVESRSLSSTTGPDITYQLKMPDKIIDNGILSNVQLEAVVYACQKHEETYDDKRLGFLIGDGAGVGKGRTIAGIVLENYLAGRKKAIWISISGDLKIDAERDLNDVCNPVNIHIKVAALHKMSYKEINGKDNDYFNEGVLFLSYSSLISESKNKDKNIYRKRTDQIIDWFGQNYDGLIILDECHKAKNYQRNKKTKTGLVVKMLQDKLKQARVIYASATGASEPKHMAYMSRLGLWGPGKMFSEFEEFQQSLTELGVGAMELIAIEMKKNGVYLARQLSFENVKFEIREVKISNTLINGHLFKDVYKKCVELWNEIYRKFYKAFEELKEEVDNNFEAQFWSSHQRFFKYLCIAGKVEECVNIAKNQVEKKNHCVVIGLQSTGEARTQDMLDEAGGNIEHFVSSAKGVLENLIKNHYPKKEKRKTNKNETPLVESGRYNPPVKRDIFDLSPVCTSGAFENKEQEDRAIKEMLGLVDEIDSMFPSNALDKLINELGGPTKVAEMTGRKGRMVETNGSISYEIRKIDDFGVDYTNILEKDSFNSGKKLYSIISDAASTGISLHSDKRFKNRRKRFHITLELPWSADKAIQQFGRTHRSNQEKTPHYLFLISDLAGERRFAATVAKRLESLGALTHGDRRSTDTRDLSQFNFDNEIGHRACRNLVGTIINKDVQIVSYPQKYISMYFNNDVHLFETKARYALESVGLKNVKLTTVTKFLNRILGMELDIQNALFQYFLDIIDCESKKAKLSNEFDYGIRDINNDHDNVIFVESYTFKTHSYQKDDKIVLNKIENLSGSSWDFVYDSFMQKKRNAKFYVSKSESGHKIKSYAYAEKESNGLFSLMRPNFPVKEVDQDYLSENWMKTKPEKVQKEWESIFEMSKDKCIHKMSNMNCPTKNCNLGKRTKVSYLLTGAVLKALKIMETKNIKEKFKIVRVVLDDHMKLVGALIPEPFYKVVMGAFETDFNEPRAIKLSCKQEDDDNYESSAKFGSVRKAKPASSSDLKRVETRHGMDYSIINEVIRSQLTKSSSKPAVVKDLTKTEKKKSSFKKPLRPADEKNKISKGFTFKNCIVNFYSEEDFQ